jgi:hypothetical protein
MLPLLVEYDDPWDRSAIRLRKFRNRLPLRVVVNLEGVCWEVLSGTREGNVNAAVPGAGRVVNGQLDGDLVAQAIAKRGQLVLEKFVGSSFLPSETHWQRQRFIKE